MAQCPHKGCNYYVANAEPPFDGYCIVHGHFQLKKDELEEDPLKYLRKAREMYHQIYHVRYDGRELPPSTDELAKDLYGEVTHQTRQYVRKMGRRLVERGLVIEREDDRWKIK